MQFTQPMSPEEARERIIEFHEQLFGKPRRKHLGPGPHPNGTDQSVHGKPEGGQVAVGWTIKLNSQKVTDPKKIAEIEKELGVTVAEAIAMGGFDAIPEDLLENNRELDVTVDVAPRISIRLAREDVVLHRYIKRSYDTNETVMENFMFHLSPELRGRGIGTKVIATQVKRAAEVGVSEIRTFATRHGEREEIGYMVWPRLGFDGPIPPQMQEFHSQRDFADVETVGELMKTPEGRAYWDKHGMSAEFAFDVRDGSESRRKLEAYLESRKK